MSLPIWLFGNKLFEVIQLSLLTTTVDVVWLILDINNVFPFTLLANDERNKFEVIIDELDRGKAEFELIFCELFCEFDIEELELLFIICEFDKGSDAFKDDGVSVGLWKGCVLDEDTPADIGIDIILEFSWLNDEVDVDVDEDEDEDGEGNNIDGLGIFDFFDEVGLLVVFVDKVDDWVEVVDIFEVTGIVDDDVVVVTEEDDEDGNDILIVDEDDELVETDVVMIFSSLLLFLVKRLNFSWQFESSILAAFCNIFIFNLWLILPLLPRQIKNWDKRQNFIFFAKTFKKVSL